MEHNTWRTIKRALMPYDPVRIENRMERGTPDVNITLGWIEVKQVDRWPVRSSTPLRVPHFTPDQRTWLKRRRRSGGLAALIIKVERDWLIFDAFMAAQLIGHSRKATLIQYAAGHWEGQLRDEELRICLETMNSFLSGESVKK